MKRFVIVLSLVVGAWAWSPTVNLETLSWSTSTAQAWSGTRHVTDGGWYPGKWLKKWFSWKSNKDWGDKGGKQPVPELDPSAAGAAMVLLLGGTAYLASRRREEDVA